MDKQYIFLKILSVIFTLYSIFQANKNTSIASLFSCVFLIILTILIYSQDAIKFYKSFTNKLIWHYNKLRLKKAFGYIYTEKRLTYKFENREEICDTKVQTVKSMIHGLPSVEEKYSLLKIVKNVVVNIENLSPTICSIEKTREDFGYQHYAINFTQPIEKGGTRSYTYRKNVVDIEHETKSQYGVIITQIVTKVTLTVVIPPELNPQNIRLVIYANNEHVESFEEKLSYSQEEHCITKEILYPRYNYRYIIKWDWGNERGDKL